MNYDHNGVLSNLKIGWRHTATGQREEQRAELAAINPNDAPENRRIAALKANKEYGVDAERNERRAAAADQGLLWIDIEDNRWNMDPANQEMINEFLSAGHVIQFGSNGESVTGSLKRGDKSAQPDGGKAAPELSGMAESELTAWTV